MTTFRERRPGERQWPSHLPPLGWPSLPGLDRGGLITGVLGLILGALYLVPSSFEGRAVSLVPEGQIPCALLRGQPMGLCPVSLRRLKPGESSLQVTHANGTERVLVFQGDTFAGCQRGRGGCGDLRVQGHREEGLQLLRVGSERYEIPGNLLQGE